MAKVGELTVGIVTKPMIQVGWVVMEDGKVATSLIDDYETAKNIAKLRGTTNEAKPVYIERVPES